MILEKGSRSWDTLKKVNSACRTGVFLKLVEELVFERQ